MKRMLFNATQSEEIRVAIINDSTIEDLDYERSTGNKERVIFIKVRLPVLNPH